MALTRFKIGNRRLLTNGKVQTFDASVNTSDPFRFTIDTTKAGGLAKSFALPLIATGSYDCAVHWGDGSQSKITAYDAPAATHTYAADGVYTVKIYGKCWGWQFNNGGDKLRIIDIQRWGKGFRLGTNEGNYFLGCSNLNITATDAPDLSATTSFENAFEGCSSLNADLSGWDVSNITTFRDALAFCTSFNHPGIASWNLASAETLQSMFYGATAFNQDLSAWDVSNVTNMMNLFNSASAFNNGGSGSIANWDTSNVTDMYGMFYNASKFNQNIGAWDVSNVTIFRQMFEGASNFINGNLAMCLPNKGTHGMHQYSQINVSPATYNGVALSAAASGTDTNLKFYSSKTSVLAQGADSLSGKIRIVTVSDYPTLSKVRFTTTGTLPANLSVDTDYWIVKYAEQHSQALTCPSYRIATSLANAQAGTFINYSDAGTGTHTVIEQDSTDGWVLGSARTQYYPNGYESVSGMAISSSGKWYTRWVYRELSAANKNVFYVSGKFVYDTPEDAEAETERNDLPTHLTNNCVLVGRIIQQWSGSNGGSSICSVISRRLGATDGIGSWNVAKATTMYGMFNGAKMFDIPLAWNAAACTDFYRFMYDCRNFNQSINGLQINPLGTLSGIALKQWMQFCRNWNNGQVCYRTTGSAPVTINLVGAGDCDSAFKDLIAFNQNMDALNLSTATQLGGFIMYGMTFNNGQAAGGTTAPLLWSAARSSHFQYMFSDCYAFNQDIGTLLQNFVAADLTFAAASGVATITRVGHGLSNGASVVILGSSDGALLPNGTYTIASVTNDTFTITAGSGTGSGTAELGARTDYMFRNATVFNRDLSAWNVSKVTNMQAMFYGDWNFNQDIGDWNTSNVTTMAQMFYSDGYFNQDISKWDVRKVTTFYQMFYGATSFNNGTNARVNPVTGRAGMDGWSIGTDASVTAVNFESMFANKNFNRYIGSWTTGKVTTMAGMFGGSGGGGWFNQDISGWDTSNVTTMAGMFYQCTNFNAPIGNWNVGKVANFTAMFYQSGFNRPLHGWNIGANTASVNMLQMFHYCSIKQNFGMWDMTKVISAQLMFSNADINEAGTTTNYDNTLLGWAAQNVQNSMAFHGGSSKYSAAGLGSAADGTGRAHLTAALNASPTPGHAWTITDGGLAA